ncbi:xaa-Pro dipeptidase-like [Tropilaelaps mercedesae]|uniref:Xaa-Pro dipeptidase n=1 Tax=Tropilaelaps mercedesae TaxID=418985 RepID=A0A1V9XTF8_9ACAR|nr:xaa-Pro dipeptidase-like [Tropilaelaps mercedesae]
MEACFHRGLTTFRVQMTLFMKNRQRLSERLLAKCGVVKTKSFVLLKGGQTSRQYCTDREKLFRQESFFHWTFGVEEPDCLGVMEVSSGRSTIFVPRLPSEYAVWSGRVLNTDDFKLKYATDEVRYVDEIAGFFKEKETQMIYLLEGENSDSGLRTEPASFKGIEAFTTDLSFLYNEICELRVIKTAEEIEVIRYANKVSSDAHKKVMRATRPGMKEYQLESLFLHHCYSEGGARHVCYTCIGASGENCAILHYGHASAPNSRTLQSGDMCLFDMGCEYNCYCSDITCSFPVGGKFSDEQRLVYQAVYNANQAVMKAAKPGVSWMDMHLLAERTILSHLLAGGLLRGDVDAMMSARLGAVFMPHGLGHFLGCDVHDVGGYLDTCPKRSDKKGLKYLRTARILEENMVLTIEPGCYFIDCLLDQAFEDFSLSQFLVADRVKEFRGIGGVRIEDDVVITSTGCENLTTVPRTIEEIENWINNK